MSRKRDMALVYYVAIAIYFMFATISDSMLGQHDIIHLMVKLVRYACTFVILIKIITERKWEAGHFWGLSIGLVLSIISALMVGYGFPFVLVVLILGAKNCSGKIIAKVHFISVGFIVALSTILSLLGVVEDRIFLRANSDVARHSFGMTYVTIWAAYMFFLYASYIYQKNTVRWYDYILLLMVILVTHYYTSTRLETGMLTLLGLSLLLYRFLEQSKISKIFMIMAFPIFAIGILSLQFLYMKNPSKYSYLDAILSGRLSYTADVLDEFRLNLFGNFIEMQGYGAVEFDEKIGYFFVDSFYIHYALRYGLIFMIALCIFYILISKRLYERGDIKTLLLLLFACAHGAIISSVILPQVCPFFIIALAEYLSKKEIEVERDNE